MLTESILNYFENFKSKAKIEISLFIKNIKNIFICIFCLVYIASAIGRNLAYYRSVPNPRLTDLGFDIIPEISSKLKLISEVIIFINHFIGISIVFSPLIYKPMINNLSTILIGKRVLNILSIGHIIRLIMYLSTSLPSPATHCLPESNSFNSPSSLKEVFTRFSTFNDLNCGDLIFSGHMFQNLSFTFLTFLYSPKILNKNLSIILSILQILNSISQIYFILAARNHYTIDIVVAIYVALTLWYINLKNYSIDQEISYFKDNFLQEHKQDLREQLELEQKPDLGEEKELELVTNV